MRERLARLAREEICDRWDWGAALTWLAARLGLPAPTDPLGGLDGDALQHAGRVAEGSPSNGANGFTWATTHPRQVLKLSFDPVEIETWWALRNPACPRDVRRLFAGSVAVAPLAWGCDGYYLNVAAMWKERVRPDWEAADDVANRMYADEADPWFVGDHWGNCGYRGRRRQTAVAFDGWLRGGPRRDLCRVEDLETW